MADSEKQTADSEKPEPDGEAQAPPASGLEHGTYEIIRGRLSAAGKDLRERLDQLNAARKEVFGSIETTLLATERITTDNNCAPRDMVPVGKRFLFGYNVHIGLKSVTSPKDVFATYTYENRAFSQADKSLIDDKDFQRDFTELFKYYKNTVFAKFTILGPHLFMVFRIGKAVEDIKTFKWLLEGDSLRYIDARSEHEFRYPAQHEFEWIRTHRDMHYSGPHPHIAIEDRLFVETVGGDLTIKIENNTESGEGIYAEDVDNKDQTLDDAEVFYAVVGNLILLKILPYQEQNYRYFVYSEKTQKARRLDPIANACVLLPDDHGIIFSNGYFLQTGEYKVFESNLLDMVYEKCVQSPNGEDFLYVFYNRMTGVYILLPYNLIEQKVESPIICSGKSFFDNGEMIYFKSGDTPQKHHAVQIWQTPYVALDYEAPTNKDSYLYKIGNKDVVRAMAESHEVLNLIAKEDSYENLFVDINKKVGDILDAYYWLDSEEAFQPRAALERIKEAARAAINEFEKVLSVRRSTGEQMRRITDETREICNKIYSTRFEVIGEFVDALSSLRSVRGEIISLRDLRYIDGAAVDALEKEVEENTAQLSQRCVEFLMNPTSLKPYEKSVEKHGAMIDGLTKVADAKELEEKVTKSSSDLEMLIEIVSNLKIDDATKRTAIIDAISAIFSRLNQIRSSLKTRKRELMRVEGVAEFNSQLKLLNQGVVNYLDVCDTPEKCEEYLTKMMVQVEELEGRFAEFDEFVVQLSEKREELYNAFEARKLQLVEKRNKRATALMNASERILKGVKTRVDNLKTINEINGYFASDLMIDKIRDTLKQLTDLGDSVKVDDIQSRMKTIREDAVRQLKDRKDLYEDGENVIRLGTYKFSVNNQALDLTTVMRDGEMQFHLSGTGYFDPITDEEFLETRDVWTQEVVSENGEIYRGEFLAHRIFEALGSEDMPDAKTLLAMDDKALAAFVQTFMGPRYSEAYVKGVHDHDAAIIFRALLEMQASVGLLRFHPRARAMASVFWSHFADAPRKELLTAKLKGFGTVRQLFPQTETQKTYVQELTDLLLEYAQTSGAFCETLAGQAGEYLFEELTNGAAKGFVVSARASDLHHAFLARLEEKFYADKYRDSLAEVRSNPASAFLLLRDWIEAFLGERNDPIERDYRDETAALLLAENFDVTRVIDASVVRELKGMVGNHPVIEKKQYCLNFNTFMLRLRRYDLETVPRYERYLQLKKDLIENAKGEMRLDEFRPRVLTSFVRNKLIDNVYLDLIGANLAKQVGVVGEGKRTDLMGLLLLISPPGYGKTTLMEYMANRLGIIFMKINGPALGHQVTSLDPVEAPNAAAREEMHKLNLAFEMGDNVMIYVDDIQHCNPEFLQKFISLCDAQRKIEGVYRGKTRTYDMRGKKVVVVMAGNPYTESGEKFKIPDMLANRADTYNLGEIIGDSRDVFELSYLENAMTSNPVLDKLASRSKQDVYSIVKMAEAGSQEGIDLEGSYSLEEVGEMVSVMQKLMRVRDVVLRVNEEYIRSAGMSDDYRTEPPFKLQGSYRNMNRLAEKVVAIMNDEELEALILSNYENDSQTLTTGAESNMLKFKEMAEILSKDEAERWADIKRTFKRNVQLSGVGDDAKFGQLILQLTAFSDGLDSIRKTLAGGMERLEEGDSEKESGEAKAITASFDAGTLDAFKDLIGELKSAHAKRQESAAASSETRPIQIVTKVPKSMLNVVEQQFKLMQNWMEPIYEESQVQKGEISKLRIAMKENIGKYQVLINKLHEAINRYEDEKKPAKPAKSTKSPKPPPLKKKKS